MTSKTELLDQLRKFARQRPGIDPGNYGAGADGWRAYNSEARSVTRDLSVFNRLLREVYWRDSITAENILAHCQRGRLTWNGAEFDYCTGQYFPTEYRKAAAALLAHVLWDYWRECKPDADGHELRAIARRELGASIANRFFN